MVRALVQAPRQELRALPFGTVRLERLEEVRLTKDGMPVVQRGLRQNSMDVTAANADRYRAAYAKMVEMVGRLYQAGVPPVAGTDDTAGFTLHRELELYVKAGIPGAECLRIATSNCARHIGQLERQGSEPFAPAANATVPKEQTQSGAPMRFATSR